MQRILWYISVKLCRHNPQPWLDADYPFAVEFLSSIVLSVYTYENWVELRTKLAMGPWNLNLDIEPQYTEFRLRLGKSNQYPRSARFMLHFIVVSWTSTFHPILLVWLLCHWRLKMLSELSEHVKLSDSLRVMIGACSAQMKKYAGQSETPFFQWIWVRRTKHHLRSVRQYSTA